MVVLQPERVYLICTVYLICIFSKSKENRYRSMTLVADIEHRHVLNVTPLR